jgi:hypothetical protein
MTAKQTIIRIKKSEWIFLAIFSLVILILSTLPYAFAYYNAPPEKEFMGFVFNTSDHAQYLSWYKAYQVENLTSNRQTSEPNPPIFFNLLWWSLGRFGKITGLDYHLVYQIFRWLSGAFFLLTTYLFTAFFFSSILYRVIAFLTITLGAGLGWILVVIKYLTKSPGVLFPLDLYIAEGNSFFNILAYPHFAEAAGLILLVLLLLLVGERTTQLHYAVYAGLVALFLGLQHAYDLLIVWLIPGAYAVILMLSKRELSWFWIKAMLIVGFISWPPALYSVILTRLSPIWKEVLAQFDNAGVFTPTPPHMLILMGAPLILALITLVIWLSNLIQHKTLKTTASINDGFLIVWFVVGWALTYIPTDYQIHMINSWQVPIGLIATIGLTENIMPVARKYQEFSGKIIMAWIGLIVLTNVYLFAWRFTELQRYNYPYFLNRSEVDAMYWLAENAPRESVVLSSYDTGSFIPGISGQRAFLSHWAQTVDFFRKRELVNQFFSTTISDEKRMDFLQNNSIDYIFWGPAERLIGSIIPQDTEYLCKIYSNAEVDIFTICPSP